MFESLNSHLEFDSYTILTFLAKIPPLELPTIKGETPMIGLFRRQILDIAQQFEQLTHIRTKRFLEHGLIPCIGWLQQKTGGVALTKDIDVLKVQSKSLTSYVQQLRDILKEHNSDILKLFQQAQDIKHTMENELKLINENFATISTSLLTLKNQSLELFNQHEIVMSYQFTMMSILVQATLARIKHEAIKSSCDNNLLNAEIIPESLLLTESNRALQLGNLDKNFALALGKDKIKWVYQLPLVHCESDEDELIIFVAIPMKSVTTKPVGKLFKFTLIPIKLNMELFLIE